MQTSQNSQLLNMLISCWVHLKKRILSYIFSLSVLYSKHTTAIKKEWLTLADEAPFESSSSDKSGSAGKTVEQRY